MAKAEWHCSVELRNGRARRYFRFRFPGRMWQPVIQWPGHKPKGDEFGRAFAPFKRHMERAERSVSENARALAA